MLSRLKVPLPLLSRTVSTASATPSSVVSSAINKALNAHIHQEIGAAFTYFGMQAWFQRPDIALQGFSTYFCDNYREEMRHAEEFVAYQSTRGGTFAHLVASTPPTSQWQSPMAALEQAIDVEEALLQELVQLRNLARQEDDCHLQEFVDKFIQHQIDDISSKTKMRTLLQRAGSNEGLFMYDYKLMKKEKL